MSERGLSISGDHPTLLVKHKRKYEMKNWSKMNEDINHEAGQRGSLEGGVGGGVLAK